MFLGGFLVTLFASVERGRNALQSSYRIYNFTVTVIHYLINVKNA